MSRVGLLGGTFNPVHVGHLAMAQAVLDQKKLDKVIFVPCYLPPHKATRNLAAARHRYGMVRSAVRGNPKLEVSDYEIKKQGKSFTIDTVRYFCSVYPRKTKFFFIIGEDTLPQLKTWKSIDEICKHVDFVTVNRPDYINKGKPVKHHSVRMPGLEIASSFLRKQIRNGKSIKYLVPESVFEYIKRHKLYK